MYFYFFFKVSKLEIIWYQGYYTCADGVKVWAAGIVHVALFADALSACETGVYVEDTQLLAEVADHLDDLFRTDSDYHPCVGVPCKLKYHSGVNTGWGKAWVYHGL